jgi:hypothetical protein
LYLNGSKVATSGSGLVFDGTNLGVGVASPAYKLDLTIGATSGAKLFKFTGATGQSLFGYVDSGGAGITRTDPYNSMVYFTTGNNIEFYTGSTLRASINSSGDFGIGTSPAFKLDVAGTGNFQGIQTSGSPSLLFGANKWMIQYESNTTRAYYCGPDASTRNNWEVYSATSTGTPLLTARFNSDRNLAINNLGLSTTPTTSGTGITFPATQAASSDANTLDDYEEGTWTPSLAGVANLNAISVVSARYTKVGNVVMCQGVLSATTAGAGTVAFTMNGPFNMAVVASPGQLGVINCYPYAGTFKQSGYIIDNSGGDSSVMYVEFYINSGTAVNLNFQLTYQTS